jgi:hypothetical protein
VLAASKVKILENINTHSQCRSQLPGHAVSYQKRKEFLANDFREIILLFVRIIQNTQTGDTL